MRNKQNPHAIRKQHREQALALVIVAERALSHAHALLGYRDPDARESLIRACGLALFAISQLDPTRRATAPRLSDQEELAACSAFLALCGTLPAPHAKPSAPPENFCSRPSKGQPAVKKNAKNPIPQTT